MGTDKRALRLGGETLLDTALRRAWAVCREVVVAGEALGQAVPPGIATVTDCPTLAGPAAGIVAGLCTTSNPHALVLACDMPFVTEALLAHILSQADDSRLAVVPRIGRRWEPLCAVYSKRCAEVLRRECTPQRSALKVFLDGHRSDVLELSETDLAPFGDPEELFTNLNTPAEVQAARESATAKALDVPRREGPGAP